MKSSRRTLVFSSEWELLDAYRDCVTRISGARRVADTRAAFENEMTVIDQYVHMVLEHLQYLDEPQFDWASLTSKLERCIATTRLEEGRACRAAVLAH
jgi:hypothetical protein